VARILILYCTGGGQTAKIAGRMADIARGHGHAVDVVDVEAAPPDLTPAAYDAVIIGAPIRNRRLPTVIRDFITAHRAALAGRPGAFFSVSLAAASRIATVRRFVAGVVDPSLREAGWQPARVGGFAGVLPSSRWSWLERQIALLFLGWPRGKVTPSRDREYTDWAAVERFGEAALADLAATSSASGGGRP
jgi:menaquinone-dependent protoporphyrinogen oxidase